MNKIIWKYEIDISGLFTLSMPKGAEILTVKLQENVPVIWASVDPSEERELVQFSVIWTGQETPFELLKENYIGTFQIASFVYHLFKHT